VSVFPVMTPVGGGEVGVGGWRGGGGGGWNKSGWSIGHLKTLTTMYPYQNAVCEEVRSGHSEIHHDTYAID